MNIKQLLGAQAYWAVNKELARSIGLHETILLQHLIDLDESFFKGMESGFYQQQSRLVKDLPMSERQLRSATNELINLGFITAIRKGVPPKYFYTIQYENLYTFLNVTFKGSIMKRLEMEQERLRIKDIKETNNQEETNNRDLDVPSVDNDIKIILGKIFFKIVDAYPKNRIGNRQHGLKKFESLSLEEAKLAAINLKRYLTVAGPYVKMLQNYITEGCFTEEWLQAEEKQKLNKEVKPSKTKTFNTNYDNLD